MSIILSKIYNACPKNYYANMVDYFDKRLFDLQERIKARPFAGTLLHLIEQRVPSPSREVAVLEGELHQLNGAYYKDPSGQLARAWRAYQKGTGTFTEFEKLEKRRDELKKDLYHLMMNSSTFSKTDLPTTLVRGSNQREIQKLLSMRARVQKNAGIDFKQLIIKPLRYIISQIALCILIPLIWLLDFGNWLESLFRKENYERIIREDLRVLVDQGDPYKIMKYLKSKVGNLTKRKSASTRKFIIDLLAIKGMHRQVHHLLKGANIVFLDKGRLFHSWKQLEGAYSRHSSHDHHPDNCRGLRSKLFKESLFWLDREGNTRLQLEKSPLNGRLFGLANKIRHLADFFRYFRDDLQQGPYGVSNHTENNPIIISFSAKRFEENKRQILRSL